MPTRAFCLVSLGHDRRTSRDRQAADAEAAAIVAAAGAAGFQAVAWPVDEPVDEALDARAGDAVPAALASACRTAGLMALATLELGRFALDDPLVARHPAAFSVRLAHRDGPIDPRRPRIATGEARARLRDREAGQALCAALVARLTALVAGGHDGVRLTDGGRIAPELLRTIVAELRTRHPQTKVLIDVDGTADAADVAAYRGIGLEGLIIAGEAGPEGAAAGVAPVLRAVTDRDARQDDPVAIARRLAIAATGGQGLVVPAMLLRAGTEVGEAVRRAVALADTAMAYGGEVRRLAGSGASVLLRADRADVRVADAVMLTLVAGGDGATVDPALLLPFVGLDLTGFVRVEGDGAPFAPLLPHEVRVLTARRGRPVLSPVPDGAAERAAAADRLVIEDVRPRVDGGAFAVKRVVGERVAVTATIYADGHEQLAAEVQWRCGDDADWTTVAMTQHPNDVWKAAFDLPRLGRHDYRIAAWLDLFGGFRRDFAKKLDAGVAQPVDHAEGRALVTAAAARDPALGEWVARLTAAGDGEKSAALLLSAELATAMAAADERRHRIVSPVQTVDAERLAARYSSWYELFPRSATDDAQRHGTFDGVIDRLPAIRDMGFDTLYFPPIHPIGRTNRKGPNNSLTPGPGDPGSPYAIGAAEGGHDAIHPELGTFEDFDRLIAAARDHGLEIALDFAVQCAPDHPWLKDHPGWFAWRPDGSMKYAENPPKKYQDIVNVDFYGPDAVPDLWVALRDVVLLWVARGVKTFRVDNPHTKPLPFWEWMIGEVRARHPDAIFLAEAFTRPAMMYRLAKIGFSQSYTYFTWRDDKAGLTDYVTELTTTAPAEFYRPHFFVNTPDINPLFLQTSGRAGFRIRAVLAATLSGLFGVYSGFELCEAAAIPGKEEYLDSEKYIVKPRDWQAPGNIIADITLLNRLRRAYPGLQTHLNTRFLTVHNDRILYYAKPAPDGGDMILAMVSLDPHGPQEGGFEVPLWLLGQPDDGSVAVEDLAQGHHFRWHGKYQHIRIDPAEPYRLWRISTGGDA